MSDDESWGFAAPPFKPVDALARLTRDLREAGLTARGSAFERRGLPLVRAAVDGAQLKVETVKQPARSPEWRTRLIKTSSELRDYVAELKKQLEAWGDDHD